MDLKNVFGKVIFSAAVETTKELIFAAIKQHANLVGANLVGANLAGANLAGANLAGAYLAGAYLVGANLADANLAGANLAGADLAGVYLAGADLAGVYLADAKNIPALARAQINILPEGNLIGWKQCRNKVIVKLLIPQKARRSNATSRICRAEYVKVLRVYGAEYGISQHNSTTEYRIGETVKCDTWNEDSWIECGGGIHFFLSRIEAESY